MIQKVPFASHDDQHEKIYVGDMTVEWYNEYRDQWRCSLCNGQVFYRKAHKRQNVSILAHFYHSRSSNSAQIVLHKHQESLEHYSLKYAIARMPILHFTARTCMNKKCGFQIARTIAGVGLVEKSLHQLWIKGHLDIKPEAKLTRPDVCIVDPETSKVILFVEVVKTHHRTDWTSLRRQGIPCVQVNITEHPTNGFMLSSVCWMGLSSCSKCPQRSVFVPAPQIYYCSLTGIVPLKWQCQKLRLIQNPIRNAIMRRCEAQLILNTRKRKLQAFEIFHDIINPRTKKTRQSAGKRWSSLNKETWVKCLTCKCVVSSKQEAGHLAAYGHRLKITQLKMRDFFGKSSTNIID